MFLKNILVLAPVAVLALTGCDDKNVSQNQKPLDVDVEVIVAHDVPLSFEFAPVRKVQKKRKCARE